MPQIKFENTVPDTELKSFFENAIENPIELVSSYYNTCLNNISLYKQLIGDYLLLLVPKYIYLYLSKILEDIICYIITTFIYLYLYIIFFHTILQYQYLIDITATDYFNSQYRFQLTYNLISLPLNLRLNNKILTAEANKINSATSLLQGASWYEREIWDFFGIVFNGNNDLRRLLTDYAFEGYPLKKDFPLSGFTELRYNEQIKRLGYHKIKTIQEFKIFELTNPWNTVSQFKFSKLFNLYISKRNRPLHINFILPSNKVNVT